ncbi:MAG: (Fe-S)-binding protein, partial [Deltaproteobacteria bacterium]|nr:(Fe-S)-binding protein [Deltaproteobacteria bacterium]
MDDQIQIIARNMALLQDELAQCTRCGICQSVCPLYAYTGREADVSRGKLALLDGLAERIFKTPEGVMERLDRCLLCGACMHQCPAGVDTMKVFIRARSILKQVTGLSATSRLVLRKILANPATFNKVAQKAIRWQSTVFKSANPKLETARARFGPLSLRRRHVPKLAGTPFHRLDPARFT